MLPIHLSHLLPVLDQHLFELIADMEPADWKRQTIAGSWTTGDILLHLLDGNMRSLSMLRDGYSGVPPEKTDSYQDILNYLNGLNADWVKAMRRLSPQIITQLLEQTGKEYNSFIQSLDPYAPAIFSVAWAGEEVSANWFHIAREYTEKWHHQQQIRLALGKEAILYTEELYLPYLETSMRALPWHYRHVSATAGDTCCFEVNGSQWFIQYDGNKWVQLVKTETPYAAHVIIHPAIAWRIFTKGIQPKEALQQLQISGNKELGEHLLSMLAVMA